MKKYTGDWNTILYLEGDEVKTICRLGQQEKTCPFLVCGADGFECWLMNYPSNETIYSRIKAGTMNAKGEPYSSEKWGQLQDKVEETNPQLKENQ